MSGKTWPISYDGAADLPEIIPLFPLSGAVFFPRANMPLNIFEPRYLSMVDDAMHGSRIIGMIQPNGGPEVKPSLYRIGCAGRIVSYGETDDGRMVIALKGISRFQVQDELTVMTPYRQARVRYDQYADDFTEGDQGHAEAMFDRARYLARLRDYLRVIQVQVDWEWVEKAPVEVLINAFAMLAPISFQEKQAMLETRDLPARTEYALAIMGLAVAEAGSGISAPGGSSVN
jgi:Lon protease-like protein